MGRRSAAACADGSRTCAVVGNSGVLKKGMHGSRCGPKQKTQGRGHGILHASIDRHEVVLRLNQAPVGGYEKWVGGKTTYRLLNNKWATVYYEDDVPNTAVPGGTSNLARYLLRAETTNTTLVVARAATPIFEELAQTVHTRRPDVQVAFLSSRVVTQARRVLLAFRAGNGENSTRGEEAEANTTPSTGFIGLYLLMQRCDLVSVYGLSLQDSRHVAEMRAAGLSYHYFKHWADSEVLRAHPHHSFSLEGALLLRLAKRGAIHVCEGAAECDFVGAYTPQEPAESWALQ